MNKGIRAAATVKFAELNELRRNNAEPFIGPKANAAFRKHMLYWLVEEFGISVASAATHYNEAFKALKKTSPELVEGLGRPEDKKGGRKKKVIAESTPTPEEVIEVPLTQADSFVETGIMWDALQSKSTEEVAA